MANGGVKLPDVKFEAIPGPVLITESQLDRAGGAMDAASADAAITIGGINTTENRLKDIQDGVVNDPVRVVRKSEYLPLLRFIYLEGGVGRGPELPRPERVMKGVKVSFPVGKMRPDTGLMTLTLPSLAVGQVKIFQTADLPI